MSMNVVQNALMHNYVGMNGEIFCTYSYLCMVAMTKNVGKKNKWHEV